VAQVEGLAAQTPVLMLFEDAQWSDPTSLELLDLIIDRVPGLRVLLIITFRSEFTPPWIGRPHVTSRALNRLAPRQRAEMIAGVTGGKALPSEIAAQIVDRTDGMPLFVEELTKAVVESGILTDLGDRYTAAEPVAPLAIPASLQASLLARFDRLAPVREVAQIGAALGRHFSHELIAAVARMPPAQLDDALAQLVGAELIYRRGIPPDAEYTFKHALVQGPVPGDCWINERRLYQPKTATADLMAMPPMRVRRISRPTAARKTCGNWSAGGTLESHEKLSLPAISLDCRGAAGAARAPLHRSDLEVSCDMGVELLPPAAQQGAIGGILWLIKAMNVR
jgi:hypothetical protein